MLRVIFCIYFGVTYLITGLQSFTEYVKTQDSILNELIQLVKKPSAVLFLGACGNITRIRLSTIENNELSQLQEHVNSMLSAIEIDRQRLLEDEQARRNWLEDAVAKRPESLPILNEKLGNLANKDKNL
jgi:hypothetical protein